MTDHRSELLEPVSRELEDQLFAKMPAYSAHHRPWTWGRTWRSLLGSWELWVFWVFLAALLTATSWMLLWHMGFLLWAGVCLTMAFLVALANLYEDWRDHHDP